jgi:aminopeptidase N
VLREAQRLARLHVTGDATLHPSLVDTTLQIGALEGDAALYEQYVSRMEASASAAEKRQYSIALAFFSEPNLLARTLAFATSSNIRTQDAPTLIRVLMQRPAASAATWEHIKANWERVERSFGIFQGIPTVVEALQHLCDTASKNDVGRFFDTHRVAGTTRVLQQSMESIDRCAAMKSAQGNIWPRFSRRRVRRTGPALRT